MSQTIWELVEPHLESEVGGQNLRVSLLRSFSTSVSELDPATRAALLQGANRTSQLVVQQLLRRTASRVAQDVQSYRQQRRQVNGILALPPPAAPAPSARMPEPASRPARVPTSTVTARASRSKPAPAPVPPPAKAPEPVYDLANARAKLSDWIV